MFPWGKKLDEEKLTAMIRAEWDKERGADDDIVMEDSDENVDLRAATGMGEARILRQEWRKENKYKNGIVQV